jgi:hypothetical protein
MVQYRRHTSRWQVVKHATVAAFPAVLAGYNLVIIGLGLGTGAVKTLGRGTYRTTHYEADPSAFVVNICVRTFFTVLFIAVAVLLWRQLRKDVRT